MHENNLKHRDFHEIVKTCEPFSESFSLSYRSKISERPDSKSSDSSIASPGRPRAGGKKFFQQTISTVGVLILGTSWHLFARYGISSKKMLETTGKPNAAIIVLSAQALTRVPKKRPMDAHALFGIIHLKMTTVIQFIQNCLSHIHAILICYYSAIACHFDITNSVPSTKLGFRRIFLFGWPMLVIP